MAVTSGTFSELYGRTLRKVFFENYTALETQYDKFCNVMGTDEQFLIDYDMGGFGSVPTKAEGTGIVYDDPVPGSTITYTWTPYGKGFRLTHEAQVDERYGQMRKMASSLGKAFRDKTESIAIDLLDGAFTATRVGFDGKELCATNHVLLRGGTARNEPSTPVDLSVSALQDALVDWERFVDESGRPIRLTPKYLVIAPENLPLAQEILGSANKPFTSDNEKNILQGWVTPIVSHYLSSTDDWFLLADKSQHDLQFFWREKLTTDTADDFDTGDGKMKAYMRCGVGFGDWRGVWGSPGI
jgi:hypothetical protein